MAASDSEHALAAAQATIAAQAAEIDRLRQRLADERVAQDLREAISLATAAGTIAAPVTHTRLLELIVETALNVIAARAASLFLIDPESNELIFEVAIGGKAEEVRHLRVPLGHGIAGLVAASGQPMAISDARSDPRQARDIAERIGYAPDSILCVPLSYGDEIIGVLELLDKQGAPSFSAEDMAMLGLFARLAGVAIEQSRVRENLTALIGEVVLSLAGGSDAQRQALAERVRRFVSDVERDDLHYRRALDLSKLVQEIAQTGAEESRACEAILRAFAQYLRSRATTQDMAQLFS